LLENADLDVAALGNVLEHESGLRGLSGTSGDLRDVLSARSAGDRDATLAFDVYVHRLVREIGSMAASAAGMDVLVFTGGMGEHSPDLRSAACARLSHLGVAIDEDANSATGDADISRAGAPVRTLVVTAAEDREVAREVRRVLTT
jgi:acetate kinase